MGLISKLFGDYSEREVKKLLPLQKKVLELEEEYKSLSDEQLKAKTEEFKERYKNGESLDSLLPEAFATCREAGDRVLSMRHFPVQIIGGIVLHQGRISEMKTGEGKTLVATLPAYLNAISGKGVHIVTVNDYLAKRDSEWMGKLYRFLGLSVGLIVHGMSHEEKREAYNADITYCTNNELGFDYLRDNMVIHAEERVQRGYNFAIVDEVDSILIDEARTPLIISGRGEQSTNLYRKTDAFVRKLKKCVVKEMDSKADDEKAAYDGDYVVDEKARTATLTPSGVDKVEAFFGIDNLNDMENMTIAHHVNQAIRAHGVMKRDVNYVVKNGEVISSAHNLTRKHIDVTAHAEILAIREAEKKLGDWRLDECELYVTLEPCMMCMGAIIESRIKKVYYGTENNSEQMYDLSKISRFVDLYNLENRECSEILTDFFKNLYSFVIENGISIRKSNVR